MGGNSVQHRRGHREALSTRMSTEQILSQVHLATVIATNPAALSRLRRGPGAAHEGRSAHLQPGSEPVLPHRAVTLFPWKINTSTNRSELPLGSGRGRTNVQPRAAHSRNTLKTPPNPAPGR